MFLAGQGTPMGVSPRKIGKWVLRGLGAVVTTALMAAITKWGEEIGQAYGRFMARVALEDAVRLLEQEEEQEKKKEETEKQEAEEKKKTEKKRRRRSRKTSGKTR
ncbi:MAG: hypothetical protein DRP15_04370 [Candidatus Aenigmatarchaeota archaeon]|nr:MAG: hypothetical protein DRP15_04370 [Candidatus Aenigmarchaeota archaeon]